MTVPKTDFDDYLEIKGYSQGTIYTYNLYYRLLNNLHPKQKDIDDFLLKYGSGCARAFLKLYLKEYLRIGSLIIHKSKGRETRRMIDKGLDYPIYLEFRNQIDDTRFALMLDITFEANLRVSELINLTPEMIDFRTGTIRGIGKGHVEYEGYLSPDTTKRLIEYIQLAGTQPNNRIFTITRQRVWAIFKDYSTKLNIKLHPHSIKHTRNRHMRDILRMTDSERQWYNRHKHQETTVEVYGSSNIKEAPIKIKGAYDGIKND